MMPLWGCDCPLLALAALALLSLAGDGPVCSQLPLFMPVFCEHTWQCLRLGFFHWGSYPGSGLLFQVTSLRLPSGHSGPILTLSNEARTSLPSPHLLVADAGVCTASPLGVTFGHVICGFKLFIYFSSHLCALWGSKARHRLTSQSVSWCLETSPFFKTPFLGWIFVPTSFASLFIFYIFPTSFQRQWAAFLGALYLLPAFRSCFLAFTQRSNVLLMNFLG